MKILMILGWIGASVIILIVLLFLLLCLVVRDEDYLIDYPKRRKKDEQ